jgi:hypothetical protein
MRSVVSSEGQAGRVVQTDECCFAPDAEHRTPELVDALRALKFEV